jgi:hypothetical protein
MEAAFVEICRTVSPEHPIVEPLLHRVKFDLELEDDTDARTLMFEMMKYMSVSGILAEATRLFCQML